MYVSDWSFTTPTLMMEPEEIPETLVLAQLGSADRLRRFSP
jgi:hypothetical protein